MYPPLNQGEGDPQAQVSSPPGQPRSPHAGGCRCPLAAPLAAPTLLRSTQPPADPPHAPAAPDPSPLGKKRLETLLVVCTTK